MMRRVLFSRGLAAQGEVIETEEFGFAPFVLVVEYLAPRKAKYGLKAHVRLRDAQVRALIRRHPLETLELFVDVPRARALDDWQKDLRAEWTRGFETMSVVYVVTGGFWSVAIRAGIAWVMQKQVVRMTLGTLMNGIEVSGSFIEIKNLAVTLAVAVDRLPGHFEAGRAFDEREARVYAPGKRMPDRKPLTPPSRWGR